MRIYLKLSFAVLLLLVPQICFACTPPIRAMSVEQMQRWIEANPCFGMDVDESKYKLIREICLVKNIDKEKKVEICNHQAYDAAKIKPVPNPDFKPK